MSALDKFLAPIREEEARRRRQREEERLHETLERLGLDGLAMVLEHNAQVEAAFAPIAKK